MSAFMLDETMQQFILLEQKDCAGGDIDGGFAQLWVKCHIFHVVFTELVQTKKGCICSRMYSSLSGERTMRGTYLYQELERR